MIDVVVYPSDGKQVETIIGGRGYHFEDSKPQKIDGLMVVYHGKSNMLIIEKHGWLRCDQPGLYTLTPAISTTTTLPASEEAKKPYRDWLHDIIRENGFCEDSKETVYAEFGGFGGLTSWARHNGVLFELRAQTVVFTKA